MKREKVDKQLVSVELIKCTFCKFCLAVTQLYRIYNLFVH